MKTLLIILIVAVGGMLIVGLAAALLIVAASSLAWLVTRFLPLETGQATLIALIAIIAALTAAWRIIVAFINAPSTQPLPDDEEDEDDEFDDDEWDDEAEDEDEADDYVPSIPRWRQRIKPTGFEGVGRNDPCPCGSGRKFKNCHGRVTGQAH